jgi:hypothetical protein
MESLHTFWRNHRLGLLYGALWSLVPMIVLEQLPLFNHYNGPDNFKQLPFNGGVCLVMLAASLPTGVLVTWLFGKLLRGKTTKELFLLSPLSLLFGAALYGFFYAQLNWTLLKPTETWGELTLGSMIIHPGMALFSFLAIGLIPLAGLNTWHLWRRVNQPVV